MSVDRKIKGNGRRTYDVQNTVGDDFGIDADLGSTLSQGEDDGVTDPKDNGHSGGNVEDFSNVG
jgi:hypothetical protein